ncbi:MAG: SDR family NAD(P)-dependent oxidoreductase [bacterium]|nr:SDR family NAD(P)-dependent oxidoreductase [bacterium]
MGMMDGSKALVTGGKRRIGRGIALALAEAGCDVGINDLQEDEDAHETVRRIEAMGRTAAFYAADISDPTQVTGLMERFGNYQWRVAARRWWSAGVVTGFCRGLKVNRLGSIVWGQSSGINRLGSIVWVNRLGGPGQRPTPDWRHWDHDSVP